MLGITYRYDNEKFFWYVCTWNIVDMISVLTGNDCLYLAGGEFPDSTVSSRVECYNPHLNTWQKLEPMQTARSELGQSGLQSVK